MASLLDNLNVSKTSANKLGVSVQYLDAVKNNSFPYSSRFAFMLSDYLRVPVVKLLNSTLNSPSLKANVLASEIEFLSKQKSVKSSLKNLSLNDKGDINDEWFFNTIQNTNRDISFSGPLSTIALNISNEIALRFMDNVGLLSDGDLNFNILSPLPINNKDSLPEFLDIVGDELSSGLLISKYCAKKEYLPSYVKSAYTTPKNFVPLFPRANSTYRRTDTISNPNKSFIELNTKKNIIPLALDRIIKNSSEFSGFSFDGFNVRANLLTSARHDLEGNLKFSYSSEKVLSVHKNIITVYYYPVTFQSSGTNSQELSFRPATSALYLLDRIPAMYFGKR